jgi:CRP-like cAMP-binding protein
MLPIKIFKKRQFVYNEGEIAREMYIIVDGSVKIIKNIKKNPVEIATLGKGSFLGEVAMFRNENHSATAIAETDTELAVINKDTFNEQLKILPNWFQTLIRNMADRLHSATEQLGGKVGESASDSGIKKNGEEKSKTEKI